MRGDSLARKEIRISGFGGQGVVLSGQILGQAASIHNSGFATLTQSYGPEARGGACTAEIVISDEPIDYPYVQEPDVVIVLSQEAYTRYAQNSAALLIIDPDLVKVGAGQKEPLKIPATRMAREMGRVVVANIIMLGYLAALSDVVTSEGLRQAVLDSVPKGTEEFNARAFQTGHEYGLEHGRR